MSASRTIASIVAVMLAVMLAGCAGSGVNAPPGPAEGTIAPAPQSQNATNESAHAGASAVTPEVRAVITKTIEAQGVSIADTTTLIMDYSVDRQQVTVTGGLMEASATATRTPGQVQSVTLEQVPSGEWRVLNMAVK